MERMKEDGGVDRLGSSEGVDPSNPLSILSNAIKAVPAVKYALGVAGIAAAGAIVTTFAGGHSRTAIFLVALVFIGMILLFLFSNLVTSRSQSAQIAGQVLLWAVTVFFVVFLLFTTTAAVAGWPCNWAGFLNFTSACANPPPTCPLEDLVNGRCK